MHVFFTVYRYQSRITLPRGLPLVGAQGAFCVCDGNPTVSLSRVLTQGRQQGKQSWVKL